MEETLHDFPVLGSKRVTNIDTPVLNSGISNTQFQMLMIKELMPNESPNTVEVPAR